MRPRNTSSATYVPAQVPTDPTDLQRYLREEFDKLAIAVSLLRAGHLDPLYVAPTRPEDGDLAYAFGAPYWNPGAGKGVYVYKTSAWVLLG